MFTFTHAMTPAKFFTLVKAKEDELGGKTEGINIGIFWLKSMVTKCIFGATN